MLCEINRAEEISKVIDNIAKRYDDEVLLCTCIIVS